jgi:hypothetical protein
VEKTDTSVSAGMNETGQTSSPLRQTDLAAYSQTASARQKLRRLSVTPRSLHFGTDNANRLIKSVRIFQTRRIHQDEIPTMR